MDHQTNKPEWVEERMALLEPLGGAAPNETRAFARLNERDRRYRATRRNWIWMTATASVACVVLIALPAKSVCCTRPGDAPPAGVAEKASAPAPTNKPVIAIQHTVSYKEQGSPNAPLVCEIYADFECPACAVFYRDTYPQLVSRYVKTGKVRIVHHDFPLPMHPFAKLAARYANAAGSTASYEAVFLRLFETQAVWAANGNIDAAIAPVLPRDVMERIRARVTDDPFLDEEVGEDVKMGTETDHINQTPTVIVVSNHVRTKIPGAVSFGVLSAYLDELLSKR